MPLNISEIIPGIPLGRGVSIAATHPEGLVALNKPSRILSHPNSESDKKRSLIQAAWSTDRERYLWKDGGKSHRFYLLHRLDSATSGVILGCVNPNLARELKTQFSKRKVAKSYYAVVSGLCKDTDCSWHDTLRKRIQGSGLRVSTSARRGLSAVTQVQVVEGKRSHPQLSLLKLNPKTGRTHQLRVQCAKRKFPIVGDSTYGNFTFNREIAKATGIKRLFLHAFSIRIEWEWKQRRYNFRAEAGMPEEFGELLQFSFPSRPEQRA